MFHGVSLGPWWAMVFACDGRELVIALDQRTYLTVVFPFAPGKQFRVNLSQALRLVLGDLRLPEPVVRAESAAVEFGSLGRLNDRTVIDVLNDVQFFAELELSYHDDLRIVQWNLNQVPHPNRDPCVPIDAVRRLYESGLLERSLTVH